MSRRLSSSSATPPTTRSLVTALAANMNCTSDKLEEMGQRPNITSGDGTCLLRGRPLSTANGVLSGIWECTPGTFDVLDRTNMESIVILQGKVILTDLTAKGDKGRPITLGPGDSAVLEFGSSVRWEVIETTRKFYTIAPAIMSATKDDSDSD